MKKEKEVFATKEQAVIKLILITNDPDLAKRAVECGVERIFVDLESLGKRERQGHRNTLISNHSILDVERIKRALPEIDLIVRVNPLNSQSSAEIERVVSSGATTIMLPMFRSLEEVSTTSSVIASRTAFIPLVETREAAQKVQQIVTVPGVTEVYIGLNDLHIELGCRFMFEPIADGRVESMGRMILAAGVPFGFGGIARVGEGLLPGELVMAEHVRMESSSVILSRTFHRADLSSHSGSATTVFRQEIQKLRDWEQRLRQRSPSEVERDRTRIADLIWSISREMPVG